MSRDFLCGAGRDSACGQELSPRSALPAGRDFGPVRTCGAFPPAAARRAPAPFTKPRAATPSEVPAHPAFPGRGTILRPLGCRDCSRFGLLAASIRKSGPEIENRCSAIVPASRMARLRKDVAATMTRPILIFFAANRTVPPKESRSCHDTASDSNFLCRKVERPDCSIVVGCRRGQDATKAA